jgi:D-sedoheptulose 7-phosphate isomerase
MIRRVIDATLDEHGHVMSDAARGLPDVIQQLASATIRCVQRGGKVLACGNGGSAADAQHLAAELVCRFRVDRPAVPAVALTTDTSALTAIANDYGFERVFARQVEALADAGDLLVAISTSGNSANVVEAAVQAQSMGCTVVALTGRGGGQLADHADLVVAVPSDTVARIQEVHQLCIHILAEAVEEAARGAGAS